ncbi:MAG TPA: ABC transporter ATP-binding protein [Actinomycetota bacterium]|nr:ABC transporter ATP-binding protein [Actinomycetota bacterium]
MPSSSSVVVAEGVRKAYGTIRAVDDLSFHVVPGECFALLGPNGAGKTTTVRMLYGRLLRDSGTLRVLGLDPTSESRRIRRRCGIVGQNAALDVEMSALDNVVLFGRMFGMTSSDARARAVSLLDFFGLTSERHKFPRELSGGMQRRLLITRALVNEPELLILDEPTVGLDPEARLELWERLASLKERGVTIVLTTHYMEEASRLCDRIGLVVRGQLIEEGTPLELIRRYAGQAVIEVREPAGSLGPTLRAIEGVERVHRTGDRTLLFANDSQRVLHGLARIDLDAEPVLRPATLEDVYLLCLARAGHVDDRRR